MYAPTAGTWPAPFAVGRRRPALWTLLALVLGAAPAAAQTDTVAAPRPIAPRTTVHRAATPVTTEAGFWERLRAEARRFRELNTRPFTYAMRYRISTDLAHTIHEAARQEGIDPELAFRLVRVESNFNPSARSHAGALGLTQLMPFTARMVDRRMNSTAAVLDPESNLRTGFRYLRSLLDRYDGDVRLALLAYNRGEGNVDRDLRRGRDPENGYSGKVMGRGLDRYQGQGLGSRD